MGLVVAGGAMRKDIEYGVMLMRTEGLPGNKYCNTSRYVFGMERPNLEYLRGERHLASLYLKLTSTKRPHTSRFIPLLQPPRSYATKILLLVKVSSIAM